MTHSQNNSSYNALLARIAALGIAIDWLGSAPDGTLSVIGLRAGRASDSSSEHVLLSAGIHGDEPAGVLGLLEFLERDLAGYSSDFSFYILPCLNPSGYERGTRTNTAGVDLNRVFSSSSTHYEVCAVRMALAERGERFVATIDLHEDSPEVVSDLAPQDADPGAYYLYEYARHSSLRISTALLCHLRQNNVQIAHQPRIYGDHNSEGVVLYGVESANCTYQGVASFNELLLQHYTNLAIVTETPTVWPLAERVRAQRESICGALNALRELREQVTLGSGL